MSDKCIVASKIAKAAELLDASPFNWMLSRGRLSPDEPIYCVEIVEADDYRVSMVDEILSEAASNDPLDAALLALRQAKPSIL